MRFIDDDVQILVRLHMPKGSLDQFLFEFFYQRLQLQGVRQLAQYRLIGMHGLGKGRHHRLAFLTQLLQMMADDRFADPGIPHNDREAAMLRMNLDHVDDLRLLRQQGHLAAMKQLFRQPLGGFDHG